MPFRHNYGEEQRNYVNTLSIVFIRLLSGNLIERLLIHRLLTQEHVETY